MLPGCKIYKIRSDFANGVKFLPPVSRIGSKFVFKWLWYNLLVLLLFLSCWFQTYFSFKNFSTKQSCPNFSREICCNFNIRICASVSKFCFSMNMIYTIKKWEILRKTNYIQRNLGDKHSARHYIYINIYIYIIYMIIYIYIIYNIYIYIYMYIYAQ